MHINNSGGNGGTGGNGGNAEVSNITIGGQQDNGVFRYFVIGLVLVVAVFAFAWGTNAFSINFLGAEGSSQQEQVESQ